MATKTRSMQSNLESFLNSATPIVPSRFLPKSAIRNFGELWHPWEKETIEFFTMGDLWSCYDEWSAYGMGVPIKLGNDQIVVQYYVPYLSAMQIFTSNTIGSSRENSLTGDCETRDSYSDSCSDETESEKSWRWEAGSSNESNLEQERLCTPNDRLGYLHFQYFEESPPNGRVPLMDKISCLAAGFPGLMTLKSIDLSPASWMAVAWYPIYHIPTGITVKELSACFLTFHTLSSTFQDTIEDEEMGLVARRKQKGITLSPFGLATHKMQGSVWVSGENGHDEERLISLFSAADSWLKQLGTQHHDFSFFTR